MILGRSYFEAGLDGLLILLSISLFLCFVRLYLGPTPPDRAVAFDLISAHAVGIFALYAVRSDAYVLLDGALVTTVLGFLSTLMISRYLERSDMRDWEIERLAPSLFGDKHAVSEPQEEGAHD